MDKLVMASVVIQDKLI